MGTRKLYRADNKNFVFNASTLRGIVDSQFHFIILSPASRISNLRRDALTTREKRNGAEKKSRPCEFCPYLSTQFRIHGSFSTFSTPGSEWYSFLFNGPASPEIPISQIRIIGKYVYIYVYSYLYGIRMSIKATSLASGCNFHQIN